MANSAPRTLLNICNSHYNNLDRLHFNHYCWPIGLSKIYLNTIENILYTFRKGILQLSATNFKWELF